MEKVGSRIKISKVNFHLRNHNQMNATPSTTDLLPDPVRWGTKERKTNKHAFAVRWPVRSYSTADWGWYWKHREWVRALKQVTREQA